MRRRLIAKCSLRSAVVPPAIAAVCLFGLACDDKQQQAALPVAVQESPSVPTEQPRAINAKHEESVHSLAAKLLRVPQDSFVVRSAKPKGKRMQLTCETTAQARVWTGRDPEPLELLFDQHNMTYLSFRWPDRYDEPGERVTIEEAQAVVEKAIALHLPHSPEALTLTMAEGSHGRRPGRYMFQWRHIVREGVETGEYITATVNDQNGLIKWYHQRVPSESSLSLSTTVTREQAELTALREMKRRSGAQTEFNVVGALLVLSHTVAPEEGPVWKITGRPGVANNEMTELDEIVIDARSGLPIASPGAE